jgi:phosphohistidine phosphatase
MMIYLMRHADAVSEEEDPARPLSAKGRDQVARVCAALRTGPGFNPSEVWHSPLARARETAELLAQSLELSAPLVLTSGLRPNDDPGKIAAILDSHDGELAVVGHEPHLGVLASMMVRGPECGSVYYPFPKAGVLALSREGKRWRAGWLVRLP